MSEVLSALLVMAALVGILMLMIPGMRPTSRIVPQGRKARKFGFLYQYGEGAGWGVALMAGFAVYEVLRLEAWLFAGLAWGAYWLLRGVRSRIGV